MMCFSPVLFCNIWCEFQVAIQIVSYYWSETNEGSFSKLFHITGLKQVEALSPNFFRLDLGTWQLKWSFDLSGGEYVFSVKIVISSLLHCGSSTRSYDWCVSQLGANEEHAVIQLKSTLVALFISLCSFPRCTLGRPANSIKRYVPRLVGPMSFFCDWVNH